MLHFEIPGFADAVAIGLPDLMAMTLPLGVPRAPCQMFDVLATGPQASGPYLLVRFGLVLSQLPDAPQDDWTYLATLEAEPGLRARLGAPAFEDLERQGFHLTSTSPL